MAEIKVVETPYYAQVSTVAQTPLRNGIMYPKMNAATEIRNGTIFASALVVGSQTWIHTLVWTADDIDTVSWSAGSISFADGTAYSIDAGDTGDITLRTYVYLDTGVSTTALQTTTTKADAIGDQKILLAIIDVGETDGKALITPLGAPGTTIKGDQITTGKIQSNNTLTYFDLDNNQIVMNDGTSNRVVIGNLTAP